MTIRCVYYQTMSEKQLRARPRQQQQQQQRQHFEKWEKNLTEKRSSIMEF